METLRRSRIPSTVVTANAEVQTNEAAQVYVHDFALFVTVQILDDTPAVLSLGKFCDEHGYTYEWVSGKQPRLTKQGKKNLCKTQNFVPMVVLGLSSSSSASPSRPALERSDELAPRTWSRKAWPMYGRQPQYTLASGQREFGDKSTNSCQGISEAEKKKQTVPLLLSCFFVA